jgi:hypothetical protein
VSLLKKEMPRNLLRYLRRIVDRSRRLANRGGNRVQQSVWKLPGPLLSAVSENMGKLRPQPASTLPRGYRYEIGRFLDKIFGRGPDNPD